MKKYKPLLDIILLVGLGVIIFFAIAPNAIVMSTSFQMIVLAAVLVLLAGFMVLLWREYPADEREAYNQTLASRFAYLAGALILIVALIIQSLNHDIDPVVPLALFGMIATKILIQRVKDE